MYQNTLILIDEFQISKGNLGLILSIWGFWGIIDKLQGKHVFVFGPYASVKKGKLELKCLLGQTHSLLEKFRFNQIIIDNVTITSISASKDTSILH